MSEIKERIPFEVGDEVQLLIVNGKEKTGVVECCCQDWARFKDGREIRLAYIWQVFVIKKADVAKEAEEFLRKECSKDEKKKGDYPQPRG